MFFLIRNIIDKLDQICLQPPKIIILLISVLIGVIIYNTILLLLWLLSGKPAGAEKQLLDKLKTKIIEFL
jgi:hypothetical protein